MLLRFPAAVDLGWLSRGIGGTLGIDLVKGVSVTGGSSITLQVELGEAPGPWSLAYCLKTLKTEFWSVCLAFSSLSLCPQHYILMWMCCVLSEYSQCGVQMQALYLYT